MALKGEKTQDKDHKYMHGEEITDTKQALNLAGKGITISNR